MGINGLWPILGDGEIVAIANLAADHFKKTGRRFYIAVDEATWRYHSLSPDQVAKIRRDQKERGHFKPEKILFYRIVRLLTLNVDLHFVFDGPKRPEVKRNKFVGKVPCMATDLWKRLLDLLPVSYHEAPGEAEAECARLQSLGIVDAAWSEDSDCLMFGCTFLIRGIPLPDPQGPSKDKHSHLRTYSSEKIYEKKRLDKEAIIAFAILNGADYDMKGLPGCGPNLALEVAEEGLGTTLCAQDYHKSRWRAELIKFLLKKGKHHLVTKCPHFPSDIARNEYISPIISSPERLQALAISRHNPINEEALAKFVGPHFNIWAKEYMKHIAPILLLRELAQSVPSQEASLINRFGLKIVKQRKKATDDEDTDNKAKVSFLPAQVSSIDLTQTKSGVPWNPNETVDFETLRCILELYTPSAFSAPKDISKAERGTKRKFNDTPGPSHSVRQNKKPASYSSPHQIAPMTTAGPSSFTYPIGSTTSEGYPRTQEFIIPGNYDSSLAINNIPMPFVSEDDDLQLATVLSGAEPDVETNDAANYTSEDDDLERAIALSLADQEPKFSRLSISSGGKTAHDAFTGSRPPASSNRILGMDRKQMEQERLARLDRIQRADSSQLQRLQPTKSSNSDIRPFGVAEGNDMTGVANTNKTSNNVPLKDLDNNTPIRRPRKFDLQLTDIPVIDLTDD